MLKVQKNEFEEFVGINWFLYSAFLPTDVPTDTAV